MIISDEVLLLRQRIAALEAENAELRKDAERLKFLESLFDRKWNGVLGSGSKYQWSMVGHYRHIVQKMVGETFVEAIDAAMKEAQS